jgi:hypothetical protein
MPKASEIEFVGHGTVHASFIMATYAYIGGSGWRVEYRDEETGDLLAKDPNPILAALEPTADGEARVIDHARAKALALEEAVLEEAKAVLARRDAAARDAALPS